MKRFGIKADKEGSLVTGDLPELTPKNDEVLVEVRAFGINRADLSQRKGFYPPPAGITEILGLELSGTIIAIGSDVSQLKVGDRVAALVAGGAYATHAVVPYGQLIPLPEAMSFTDGASIPEAWITAYVNLFLEGKLAKNERVLIHGASSGVGTAAIQMAKSFGALVSGTAGGPNKIKRIKELGVEVPVDYKTQDFVHVISNSWGKNSINVIIDMIAGDYFPKNISLLAQHGRIVMIAYQKGREVALDVAELMKKRARVLGSVLRPRSVEEKKEITQGFVRDWWPKVCSGELKPVVDKVYKIEDLEKAHERMTKGENFGKLVVQF